jgi:hypothetical protein
MKKLLIVLLAFSIGIANAQFSDPFTDGNFTDDPVWTGDAALFEVNGPLHAERPHQQNGMELLAENVVQHFGK